MHGLIFVTWEKFLSEEFGKPLLQAYRDEIEATPSQAPLASRVYDDAQLLAGVEAACRLTNLPAATLLRKYGRYFIINSLTRYRCAYLLTQVHSGKELLLAMSQAHDQMSRTPDGLTPPVFGYEALPGDTEGLVLIYQSKRKLCPLLLGAIEGAAQLYDEQVCVVEHTCMQQGASACRIQAQFFALQRQGRSHQESAERRARVVAQRSLADLVLSLLPEQDGATLQDIQRILYTLQASPDQIRPAVLLQAVQHLQHVGLAASTANQPGDNLTRRRYWRVPLSGKEQIIRRAR